ncbi:MAG TPA: hypothetical protein VIG76_12345 [Amnibacterium sp.]|uniref:hypothetical protein n=1 Tax=Amnibacterium sp. TaxID=1872496 RepID=UPI002F948BBB
MSLTLLAPARPALRRAFGAEWQLDRANRRTQRDLAREAAARCQCTGCRIERAR